MENDSDEKKILVVNIGSKDDLKKIYQLFTSDEVEQNYIFRAQANDKWHLQSSLERVILQQKGIKHFTNIYSMNNKTVYEDKIFSKLLDCSPIKDEIEKVEGKTRKIRKDDIMAFLQHYDAPTRLLDFTEKFRVACFFNFIGYTPKNRKRAIWIVPRLPFENQTKKIFGYFQGLYNGKKTDSKLHILNQDVFNLLLDYGNQKEKTVGILNRVMGANSYRHFNPRQKAQNGLFLFPTSFQKTFEECFFKLTKKDRKLDESGHDERLNEYIEEISSQNYMLESNLNELKIKHESNLFPVIKLCYNPEYETIFKLGYNRENNNNKIELNSFSELFPDFGEAIWYAKYKLNSILMEN